MKKVSRKVREEVNKMLSGERALEAVVDMLT